MHLLAVIMLAAFQAHFASEIEHNSAVLLPQAHEALHRFSFGQNYPNPFNPPNRIEYHLRTRETLLLRVFNVSGQQVATLVNETEQAGTHTVQFDASRLPGGVYFCRLRAGGFEQSRKMVLIR